MKKKKVAVDFHTVPQTVAAPKKPHQFTYAPPSYRYTPKLTFTKNSVLKLTFIFTNAYITPSTSHAPVYIGMAPMKLRNLEYTTMTSKIISYLSTSKCP